MIKASKIINFWTAIIAVIVTVVSILLVGFVISEEIP